MPQAGSPRIRRLKIVVIGGTGLIGSKLVENLRKDGHAPPAAPLDTGVDLLTGEGLAEALEGAKVVVDVANAPAWDYANEFAPEPGEHCFQLAEMITTTTSTDPLVEVLVTRLRVLDLVGWQRIAAWAEESGLSFEDLRLLLACALKVDDGPVPVSELGELAGFPLEVAYPATHSLRRRGYLVEEGRHYSLSEKGKELVATLDAAHREGPRGLRRPARSKRTPATRRRVRDCSMTQEVRRACR